MEGEIKLGYEVKNIKEGIEGGKEVYIKPSHLICTGITQKSGKTTTLEALITRSGKKAVVFKTKIGEKSFANSQQIPPFFKSRSDYAFVASLIEAYSREKLYIEKGTLMRLCKGTKDLLEIKKRVDEELAAGKLRGINLEIYTRLQHYLDNLIPQIQFASFSNTLNLQTGVNLINLERFEDAAQSLIIEATVGEILKNQTDTIVVIPEAWKFVPQKYNNPCKRTVEEFIRQGAANGNYLWIDSQDMAGVDKGPLKSVSTWILGYQSERNEVEHTLDQIALPSKKKPKPEEVMTLEVGFFFVSTTDGMKKVYVQPAWMEPEVAQSIAMGKTLSTAHKRPDALITLAYAQTPKPGQMPFVGAVGVDKREIIQLRADFFNKTEQMEAELAEIKQAVGTLQIQKPVDPEEVASLVLQKMPRASASAPVDLEAIVRAVSARMPAGGGNQVYQVAPLEKIRRDFVNSAKEKLLGDIGQLDDQQKKILKFVETRDAGCKQGEILSECLYLSTSSGGSRDMVSKKCRMMDELQLVRMDKNSIVYKKLRERIEFLLAGHTASPEEMTQVYNHIMASLI